MEMLYRFSIHVTALYALIIGVMLSRCSATESSCPCGQSPVEARIVYGQEVSPIYKYPWIVKILQNGYVCTGAIVSHNKVLTAAHCVLSEDCSGSNSTDSYGGWCLINVGELEVQYVTENGLSSLPVVARVPNRDFHPRRKGNDVAVITVAERFPCNSFTRPVCLPEKEMVEIGNSVIIAGFGQSLPGPIGVETSGTLMEGSAEVLPQQRRENDTACSRGPSTDFCTKGPQYICYGDSGGSAFVKDPQDDRFYSVGIASFSRYRFPCDRGSQNYFTSVFQMMEWIKCRT